jgi:hypothetical protein
MAFTAGELTNIANASLDYFLNKGDTFKQTLQNKPLLSFMEKGAKSFPGGKGDISLAIKGVYGAGGTNDGVAGFTHNDTVNFYTPANIDRVKYPWREHHIGLTLTHTELKIDGLSVVDTDGKETSAHSQREMHVLVNLLEDKLEDFGEQYSRSMNKLLWGAARVTPRRSPASARSSPPTPSPGLSAARIARSRATPTGVTVRVPLRLSVPAASTP